MNLYEQQTESTQHSRCSDYPTSFYSWQGKDIFLYPRTSATALWTTWTLIHWVLAVLSQVQKSLGHEADHSCPSSAKVKKVWNLCLLPLHAFMSCTKTTLILSFFTGNNWASRPVMCAEYQGLLLCEAHILLSHKTNSLHGLAVWHCHLQLFLIWDYTRGKSDSYQ